jgi:hypothetical protein
VLRAIPLLAVVTMAAAKPETSLQFRALDDPTRIEVIAVLKGSPDKYGLSLTVLDQDKKAGPAILGSFTRDADRLIFKPRYRLVHGLRYRATLTLSGGSRIMREHTVPPLPLKPSTVITRVYPSGEILPANNLKFYLHFSSPMRETRAIFDQVQIIDPDGKTVHNPWRRQELWSNNATRLTLWIHPGRIKTGINLREEEGPVLHPGRHYTLLIPSGVKDARGIPLLKAHRKIFLAGPMDHNQPRPDKWMIHSPRSGSRDPLRVRLDEPIDHALLLRMLTIRGPVDGVIEGTVQVLNQETLWIFQPREPWQAKGHWIDVDAEIEDHAGNTPTRMFDTDLRVPTPEAPTLRLPFTPTTTN